MTRSLKLSLRNMPTTPVAAVAASLLQVGCTVTTFDPVYGIHQLRVTPESIRNFALNRPYFPYLQPVGATYTAPTLLVARQSDPSQMPPIVRRTDAPPKPGLRAAAKGWLGRANATVTGVLNNKKLDLPEKWGKPRPPTVVTQARPDPTPVIPSREFSPLASDARRPSALLTPPAEPTPDESPAVAPVAILPWLDVK